ncbi:MAG: hypothetical protein Q4D15_08885, partial [Lachnospiraceae bacterium]|nr:hypothetical protein [Lachnospiraceae bacterium]
DWGDWKTITPATDASEGAEERECSRCHMKETQSIPPLTHIHGLEHINAVSASCTEPGNIEYWQCNTSAGDGMTPCHRYFADEAGTTEINAEDTVVKALGHTWDDGVITKEPTTYSVGEKTYTCTVCKETKTEDIPKLDLADYTAVDSAKAKAAALDRDQYTEDSLKAVDDAVAAVIEGKPLSEQEAVNAMATAIENAIAALVLKPEKQAEAAIENLPKAEDLTLADADAVKEARAAYEALSDEEKETFPDTVLKDLKLAETTLAKLEAQAETAKMQEEIDKLNEALAQAAKEIAEMKEALAKTPGWHTNEDGKKYYCDSQGEMVKGWISDDGKWYFTDKETGFMQTDWLKDGSTWYYLNEDGAMATGWVKDDDKWYYMNTSGAMMTGWVKVGNTWYFMTSSGAMAANEWCNGYWLNANGSWTYQPRGSWKQDSTGWWFGDTSGWYAKSTTQKIDGTNYTFNAAGYWVQ